MMLIQITVYVHAPELTSHHSSSHSLKIGMAKEPLRKVHLGIIDAIVQLDAQLPRQVIVTINEARNKVSGIEFSLDGGVQLTASFSRPFLCVPRS